MTALRESMPQPEEDEAPYKAYVALVGSLMFYVLLAWLFDETPRRAPEFTAEELKDALKQGLIASGFVSAGVYVKKNSKRPKRRRRVS